MTEGTAIITTAGPGVITGASHIAVAVQCKGHLEPRWDLRSSLSWDKYLVSLGFQASSSEGPLRLLLGSLSTRVSLEYVDSLSTAAFFSLMNLSSKWWILLSDSPIFSLRLLVALPGLPGLIEADKLALVLKEGLDITGPGSWLWPLGTVAGGLNLEKGIYGGLLELSEGDDILSEFKKLQRIAFKVECSGLRTAREAGEN